MDNRFRPLRAIVFVVACVALLVFTYVLVYRVDFGGSTTVRVRFDAVGTIQTGSPVRQSGVKVGTVARVTLVPEDRKSVDVELSLYRGLIVRTSDRIAIVTGGLLGDQYIDVAAGSADAPVAGPSDVIRGDSGLDLKALVDGGSSLVKELGGTTQALSVFLASHQSVLDRILADTARGVAKAADAAEKADRLLAKAEGIVDDTAVFVGKAKAAVDPTVAEVRTTLKTLGETAASLRALVDGLAAPKAVGGLLSSPTTAKAAADALENLLTATQSLKAVATALEAALK